MNKRKITKKKYHRYINAFIKCVNRYNRACELLFGRKIPIHYYYTNNGKRII